MDNPNSESGTLNLTQAASAFSSQLSEAESPPETDEDRAVKLVESESPTESPEAEAEAPDTGANLIPIEIDGKIIELTQAQIAEAYKSGLRQSDYTKKTMEAAEVRKGAEAEKAKAQQERNEYAQKLNDYAIQLRGALQDQSQTDWQQLLDSDPITYLKQRELFSQRQSAYQTALGEQQKVYQQQQAEQAEYVKSHFAMQQQELLAKLPEWKDDKKATADKAAIKEYLQKSGYQSNEVDGVADHRAVILARKAMLYDNLIARAKTAATKVAPLPTRFERPGAGDVSPTDKRTEAQRRLAKSGSINDAAAVFAALL